MELADRVNYGMCDKNYLIMTKNIEFTEMLFSTGQDQKYKKISAIH